MFTEDGIPMKNLIADLRDSANTAWSGVEKRLRDLAPPMLYIGGDTCRETGPLICCILVGIRVARLGPSYVVY